MPSDYTLTDNPLCECGCGGRILPYRNRKRRFLPNHASRTRQTERIEPFHYTIDPVTQCWVWNGILSIDGYGVGYRRTKIIRAHRWSYEQHLGPIPKGTELHHTCENKACVNPQHLLPVTRAEHRRLSPTCKLTIEQARQIRSLYPAQTQTAIAKQFGVSQPIVSAIILGKIWRE